jgi:hypothetical protein
VQTFLPYSDFDRSAAVLDSPRLGKQRVETLQILRALTFPTYGWASHPAKVMWQGYVPALTSYGLAMVHEWTGRGGADSTWSQIAEFAPEAATTPTSQLAMPSWLGDERVHRSHRSNLVRKDSAFYAPRFPGIQGDLDYFWPGADALRPESAAASAAATPKGPSLVILRPRDDDQLAEWLESGGVTMGETSPRGQRGPQWLSQLEAFSALPTGTRVAAIEGSGTRLFTAELTGGSSSFVGAEEAGLRRTAAFDGELARSDFPYPALLQNPRAVFEVPEPGPAGDPRNP